MTITRSITTVSVADCDGSLEISPNPYDVNSGTACDVKEASNTQQIGNCTHLKSRTEPVLPIDHLADRAAEQAFLLLDALDRYRLAQYDLDHSRHAPSQANEEDIF